MNLPTRVAARYADFLIRHPLLVLLILVSLVLGSGWAASQLRINSNQLDLISQDLQEVKDVKRIIDIVGGVGHLNLALRSDDEAQLKLVADELAEMLRADQEHVRFVNYKFSIEFVRERIPLFIKTEDLQAGRERINAYLKDQLKRNNPFFIEIRKTEPVKLDLQDLIDKYVVVGKKNITDDYFISNDRKMILLAIKPMWDSNQLDRTQDFIALLQKRFEEYSKTNKHGIKLVEDYDLVGKTGTMAYGFTGSYKLSLDDSWAVINSLRPVILVSFLGIFLIMALAFRKALPVLLISTGMAFGALLTMGFTYVTVGTLNMITSVLGGIIMGLGEDFGTHFAYKIRQEFGHGKNVEQAVKGAIVHTAMPAMVSAVATSGSFFALCFSQFRGFSQFGLLSGVGIFILGLFLFAYIPAILLLVGKKWPHLPAKLMGATPPPVKEGEKAENLRVPRPRLQVAIYAVVAVVICAAAIGVREVKRGLDYKPTLLDRFTAGTRFDYNSRALMPAKQDSVKLNDEVRRRFDISADPTAIFTKTLDEAKEVFNELHPLDTKKYSTVDQVVSIYSFLPPRDQAERNAKILKEWREELKDIKPESLPPDLQEKGRLFLKMLEAEPYGLETVPAIYHELFTHISTTKPENQGWLTFLYPKVDLWDGRNMLQFSDETAEIKTKEGNTWRSAGAPILYAKLARIVLFDGKLSVFLTAVWIFFILYLDFRSLRVALAAILPLGLGMGLMLGIMAILDEPLNFMNIVVLPVVLGYGVSHGVYLMHAYLEGTSPMVALRSVGTAVFTSTVTTIAGFFALLWASHKGLRSMGLVACIGLTTTLAVSLTLLAAILQLMHDRRSFTKEQARAHEQAG